MGSIAKHLKPPGMGGKGGKLPVPPGLGALSKFAPPGAPPLPGMGGKGGKSMSAPTGVPGAPAGPPPIVGAGGVAQGATPQGFGATSVGTSPVMDQQAQAYSPGFGGRHRMGFHGGGLPPGIDPQAVAANPQGYQQWQQAKAMQGQGAVQPGMQGGMTDPNAGAPNSPPSATGLLGNAPPEVQQQLQQQGPQVPGGGAGPSDQAAQMMQAMAQAKALRTQPQQQAPGVGQQYESTGA